jgi:hypothetical protein
MQKDHCGFTALRRLAADPGEFQRDALTLADDFDALHAGPST